MSDVADKGLWAKCPACAQTWVVAFYPAPVEQVARLAKGHADCPKCETPGVVAMQRDGQLTEPAA